MTTPDGQSDDRPAGPRTGTDASGERREQPPSAGAVDLVTAACRPGIDPCDLACEAMPAHVVGDLTSPETDWLIGHTADCRYCANELDRFVHVGHALDRIHQHHLVELAPPPIPRLQRRPRAHYALLDSPVGPLFVAASNDGLCEIDFAEHETVDAFRRRLAARGFEPRPVGEPAGDAPAAPDREVIDHVARQLREYFGGRRDRFELPLDFTGVTPFTRDVLDATAEVPFGRLDTYRGIALRVGNPRATRAVGNALGRNPIPVVVPCHRIVRSDASLGGYTGGLHIKQRLLALEGVTLA